MAFPTMVGQGTWNTGAAATAHKAVITANTVNAGDLIVVWWAAATAAGGLGTLDGKWTPLIGVVNGAECRVVYCIADGTETGATLQLTTVASSLGISTSRVYRNFGDVPQAASATGASTTPDPPNLAPTGWGAQDIEWLESIHHNAGGTFTGYSTNYGAQASNTPRTGVGLNIGNRTLNATSENPGTTTTSASVTHVAVTVAIPGLLAISGLDDTGTGTGALAVIEVDDTGNLTDTGAGTDALGISVTPPSSDEMGAGDDAFAITVTPPSSDETGTGSDALSVSVQAAVSGLDDTATGAESLFIDAITGLSSGKLWVGRFVNADPLYTINNEIIAQDQVDNSRQRPNIVSVDGEDDSWTEYDRGDLTARQEPINEYLDLPELRSPGDTRQRAVEDIEQARRASSPGGDIVWDTFYTRMDRVFWIDEHGSKYETRIEGISVEFNQSTEPFQRATIDTGLMVLCPPDAVDTYIARDLFERQQVSSIGTATTGGAWTIYN